VKQPFPGKAAVEIAARQASVSAASADFDAGAACAAIVADNHSMPTTLAPTASTLRVPRNPKDWKSFTMIPLDGVAATGHISPAIMSAKA
jgi:hypothetical protein